MIAVAEPEADAPTAAMRTRSPMTSGNRKMNDVGVLGHDHRPKEFKVILISEDRAADLARTGPRGDGQFADMIRRRSGPERRSHHS